MKQKNSTKHNTQNWRQRLKVYSTMAVAFTALTPTVLGEANPNLHPDTDAHLALPETVGTMVVQCNDIADITISASCPNSGNYTDNTSLDLDGDGVNDFRLVVRDICESNYSTKITGSARVEGIGRNEMLIQDGASAAYVCNGALLQGSGDYTNTGTLAYTHTYPYYSRNIMRGDFAGTTNGYVAVKFDIGGNTHLGWIALSVTANARSLTITAFGYEDTPNTPIEVVSCTTGVTCTADSGTFAEPPAKK